MKEDFYSKKQEVLGMITPQFPEGHCVVTALKAGINAPCQVTLDNAARLIAEGGFRLATEEEIRSFNATMETNRACGLPVNDLASARALFAVLQAGKDRK